MGLKSPSASDFDHGGLTGRDDDDHTQYALRSILTTLGDTLYAGVAAAWTRLAGNTTATKQFLTQTGTGAVSAAPVWGAIADSDIPATIARDTEVTTAITDHEAAADPHPGYLTPAEGDTAYAPIAEPIAAAHIADATDAHDASAISILDTAGDFDATDVEAALAELQTDAEAHVAAADPHTGYRLESADHSHQSTGAQAGQLDHGLAMSAASLLDDDHTGYLLVSGARAMTGTLDLGAIGKIQFPATQSASAGANVLDDYEEGTWTPAFTFAVPGDLSVTYSSQTGYYLKIGKWVFVTWAMDLSAFTHTTASSTARITGLPFAVDVDPQDNGTLLFQGITLANYTQFVPRGQLDTFLLIGASGSGQSRTNVSAADMPSGGTPQLRGSFFYLAAN